MKLFAVAFRLYDLNHTGYIERDEVSIPKSQFLRMKFRRMVDLKPMKIVVLSFQTQVRCFVFLVCIYIYIYVLLQLKDMVLALLYESNLTLEDDFVEAIVDKVWLKYNVNNVQNCNLEKKKLKILPNF